MDKYIFCYKEALTSNQCKYIISFFEDSPEQHLNLRGYSGIYPAVTDDNFKFIAERVERGVEEYKKLHPFLGERCDFSWDIYPKFNIQKYFPGDSYGKEHMEHGWNEEDSLRILAWMVYLNDIDNGGGTCFPGQNFITTPREGDLYIWPAFWTHSHYGVPAPEEEKYIVTGWYNLNMQEQLRLDHFQMVKDFHSRHLIN